MFAILLWSPILSFGQGVEDGLEDGIWLESAVNTVDWSGVAFMSPLWPRTRSVHVAVYPVDGAGAFIEEFDPNLVIRAATTPALAVPGWTIDKEVENEGLVSFPESIATEFHTGVELTLDPLGAKAPIDSFSLQATSYDGYLSHRRVWSEKLAPGAMNCNITSYFEYGTPFPVTFPGLGADFPVGAEYKVVLKGLNVPTGAPREFGICGVGTEQFGIQNVMCEHNFFNGDSFIIWLELQIKRPPIDGVEQVFTTFRTSGMAFVDLDPSKVWLPGI